MKNARIERVTVLEEPWRGEAAAEDGFELRPFETVTLRLTGELPPFKTAAAKEPWTGLLTRPRVFPGGKNGTTYLLWGTDDAPDFDHYEIYRDGLPLATVTNIVDEGVLYRNARYEDAEASPSTRHVYRVRSVYNDGRKGAWSEFTGLDCDVVEFGEIKARCTGAYVWSWRPTKANGEALFMQEHPPWGKEVHGGIPICWPWFGAPPKEGLPKHGLARYATWKCTKRDGESGVVFELDSNDATRALWPHDFHLEVEVRTDGDGRLIVRLTETNTGKEAFESAWGFHPYFRVTDAERVAVDGERQPRPSVLVHTTAAEKGRRRTLTDLVSGRVITVESNDNEDWMVWNPGVDRTPLCVTLGPDEWKRFYCIEPCTLAPRPLAPGQSRTHEMICTVLPSR